MVNDQEILEPSNSQLNTEASSANEQERLSVYKDILYREATFLLAKYLPEALPQEPTDIGFSIFACYEGKFKGTHYISASSEATDDFFMARFIRDMKKYPRERRKEDDKEDHWDELTGLLRVRHGYSVNTWKAVNLLVHELIHQRHYELNPTADPDLSSSELDQINLENVNRNELRRLIREANLARGNARSEEEKSSICWPVIEGMAEVGSFYVMVRLEKDLIEERDAETADKVRRARSKTIFSCTLEIVRAERRARFDFVTYDMSYPNGFKMMRKLYKQFGKETPRFLEAVDLNACWKITKNSPEYQQIMENPALLPGLPRAV